MPRERVDVEIRAREQTRQAAMAANRNFESLKSSVTAISTGFLAAAAAGRMLTNVVTNVTAAFVGTGQQLRAFERRIGISAQAMDELVFVGKQFNVQEAALSMGLQRMTRRLGEISRLGRGEAKPAMEALGLSIQDLINLSPDEQFLRIADALSEVENASERTALAMKFFDSEGVALVQTMEGGSAAMREMMEEARRLGSFTEGMAVRAERAAQQGEKLARAWRNVKIAIADELLSSVTDNDISALTSMFTELAKIAGSTTTVTIDFLSAAGFLGRGGGLAKLGAGAADRLADTIFGPQIPKTAVSPLGGGLSGESPLAGIRPGRTGLPGGVFRDDFFSAGNAKPVVELFETIERTSAKVAPVTEFVREVGDRSTDFRNVEEAVERQLMFTKQLSAEWGANVIDRTFLMVDQIGFGLARAAFQGEQFFDVLRRGFQNLLADLIGGGISLGLRTITGDLLRPLLDITDAGGGTARVRSPRSGLSGGGSLRAAGFAEAHLQSRALRELGVVR